MDHPRIAGAVLTGAFLAVALPAFAKSLCAPTEDAVFVCRIGGKLASVCSSKAASRDSGYLQYRFGKAGADAPEIALPETRTLPSRSASGENLAFSGGGGSWLRFKRGDFAYVAYSGIGKWGPKGEAREKSGVMVERSGKAVANLKCRGTAEILPGADWYERLGIAANGEDFDFPG